MFGGDLWDFRPLRSKASEVERRDHIADDFEVGFDFLEEFAPDSFILGNHDARLWDVAEVGEGLVADYAKTLIARTEKLASKIGCRIIPHDKLFVLKLGPLNILHGYYAGMNAARQHAQIYGPAIFGHVHTDEHCVVPSHDGRREAWASPALCKLSMDYNRKTPSTLRYMNGWMYGAYNGNRYHVETARVVGGQVVVSTGFGVISA